MNMTYKIAVTVTVLLFALACIPNALAKDLNLPTGASRIDYYNAGGYIEIPLPAILPTNVPPSATAMMLRFCHFEVPNSGVSADNLIVEFYMIPSGFTARTWTAYAEFTTSEESAAFERTFWSGTPMVLDATLYGAPAILSTNNVFVVSKGTLSVERHGNDVTLNLNSPQTVKRALTANTQFVIPSMNLELKNYGASIHQIRTDTMTGSYKGASGYSLVTEQLAFDANGILTSAWYPDGTATSNSLIIMRGTHTFYPPT